MGSDQLLLMCAKTIAKHGARLEFDEDLETMEVQAMATVLALCDQPTPIATVRSALRAYLRARQWN